MPQLTRGNSPPVSLVDLNRLPQHIAIIMDGNGRWAQAQGRLRTEGHAKGSDAVRTIVRASRRLGIESLTLYAFSEQNWSRPKVEVAALMGLLRDYLISERQELLDNGIRLKAIGRLHKLPHQVRDVLDPLVLETASNTGMTLTLALSYGGREEIADAIKAIAKSVMAGGVNIDTIDETMLSAVLPSLEAGPVDLLIRAGGEERISNFLLWGAAYAEFCFTNQLWPDFDAESLYEAIVTFQQRERRFGEVLSDIGALKNKVQARG